MSPPSSHACSGTPVVPATRATQEGRWMAEAAEWFCYGRFAEDFLQRNPGGVVIRDIEHLFVGHTNSKINRVLKELAQAFRSFRGGWDSHKPDGLGISRDGQFGELMEVTTENRYRAVRDNTHIAVQIQKKLHTLNTTVNATNPYKTHWRATRWKPKPDEICPLNPAQGVKWICFRPTHRYAALEAGIALYEVHALDRLTVRAASPFVIPQLAREKIHTTVRSHPFDPGRQAPLAWATEVLGKQPEVAELLRYFLTAVGAVLLLAALMALPLGLTAAASIGLVCALPLTRPALAPQLH